LGGLPRKAQLYIGLVVAAAAVAIATSSYAHVNWVDVAVLALLAVVCESTSTLLRANEVAWSANSAAILAAVVLVGPAGAALVGVCALVEIRRTLTPTQRAFNAGMFTLAGFLPGTVFVALGGHVGAPGLGDFPSLIGVFAGVAVVHVVVNFSLLQGVLLLTRTHSRHPGEQGLAGFEVRLLLADLGYCAFGLLIAALWGELKAFAPVLVLIPLFVARWAVAQFAAQQRAYEATVSALCQAVETKDFYTRGHSERVSRGSVIELQRSRKRL